MVLTVERYEPVSVVEIGERLGVEPNTVHMWRYRSLGFPERKGRAGGVPLWDWPDIEAWARATGRLGREGPTHPPPGRRVAR